MSRQRISSCRLFDGKQMRAGYDVIIDNGRISEIAAPGAAANGGDATLDLGGQMLAPGLIDLQVNGGGGVLFNAVPTLGGLQAIVAAHRATGTTACLPTLITDNEKVMREGIDAVAAAMAQKLPGILGMHLEGPHLSPEFRGVHDASFMRALDADALSLLTSLQAGKTLLTIAPETVSGEAIKQLRDAGVVVFAGHSAASYDETRAALKAGVTGFTHLFNAMSPLTSRAPGMVGAALDDAHAFIGIIVDGHHVHPATIRIALRAKVRGKVCLVTDAMPTVGADATQFELHGKTISAVDGRCVTEDGTLAGSNIGMIDAVRNAANFAGVDTLEALRMAAAYPAAALGLDDSLGYIRPGYRANLVALDENLRVTKTWIDGQMEMHA